MFITRILPIKDLHDWQNEYYSDPYYEYNHPAFTSVKRKYMESLRRAVRAGKFIPPICVMPIATKAERELFKEQYNVYPPKNKKWSVEDGHHRLLAHTLEGKTEIETYIFSKKQSNFYAAYHRPSIASLMCKVPLTQDEILKWKAKNKLKTKGKV